MSEILRAAKCQCESFLVVVVGDPDLVNACHCIACQRRTGTPMSVHAHFRQEQIALRGLYRTFTRVGERERRVKNYFCPNCGTTLCWQADLRPNHFGVAIGALNDPQFPAPTLSLWEQFRYSWVLLPRDVQRYARSRPSDSSTGVGL